MNYYIVFVKTNYWGEYLDIIERKEQEDKENYVMKTWCFVPLPIILHWQNPDGTGMSMYHCIMLLDTNYLHKQSIYMYMIVPPTCFSSQLTLSGNNTLVENLMRPLFMQEYKLEWCNIIIAYSKQSEIKCIKMIMCLI
jgi:predicted cupin superfamily sugar epimerase